MVHFAMEDTEIYYLEKIQMAHSWFIALLVAARFHCTRLIQRTGKFCLTL